MTVFVSDEVEENRILASEQPETFKLAVTTHIWCDNDDCENRLEVFQKDAEFISWFCEDCDGDDFSDDFPLYLEYDEGW